MVEEDKKDASHLDKGEEFKIINDSHAEKIAKLLDQLEVLMNRKDLREVGAIRPYSLEWEATSFPKKYKSLQLESYDWKGWPNQHMYYFLFLMGHLTCNDPMITMIL